MRKLLVVLAMLVASVFSSSAGAGVSEPLSHSVTVSIGPALGGGSGYVQGDTTRLGDVNPNPFACPEGFFVCPSFLRASYQCNVTPAVVFPLVAEGCSKEFSTTDSSFYVFATASPGFVFSGWLGCPGVVYVPTRSCASVNFLTFALNPQVFSIVLQPIFEPVVS